MESAPTQPGLFEPDPPRCYYQSIDHECGLVATHRVWADVTQVWHPACRGAAAVFATRTLTEPLTKPHA